VITAAKRWDSELEKLIDAVASQTYQNIEHIIKLGTDCEKGLIKKYEQDYSNLVVLTEKDIGIYDALNISLNAITGELVIFLHVGDYWESVNHVSYINSIFQNDPSLDLVYGNVLFKDGPHVRRKWISSPFKKWKLLFGWMPPHTSVTAKKALYGAVGPFKQNFRVAGDYEWLVRALQKTGINARYDKEIYVMMKPAGLSSNSWRNILLKINEDYAAITDKKLLGWATVILKRIYKLSHLVRK
jgi:glycosyltransferase involved in cell wall biosynthesis